MLGTTLDTDQSESDFLRAWQQGDYTCDCKDFVLMDQAGVAMNESGLAGAVCSNPPVGAVVISQTCDIVRLIDVIPYVTVCPLLQMDKKAYDNIERAGTPRMGLLPAVSGSLLAVDFSRTMSVKKEALKIWERERGCRTEKEQVNFANAIEMFFGRFPFPDDFVTSLRSFRKDLFSKHRKPNSPLGRVLRYLEEIRVVVNTSHDESGVEVKKIAFLCILPTPRVSGSSFASSAVAPNAYRGQIEEIEKREIEEQLLPIIKAIRWIPPYELHPNAMYLQTLNQITAADYVGSYSLDVNAMSPIS